MERKIYLVKTEKFLCLMRYNQVIIIVISWLSFLAIMEHPNRPVFANHFIAFFLSHKSYQDSEREPAICTVCDTIITEPIQMMISLMIRRFTVKEVTKPGSIENVCVWVYQKQPTSQQVIYYI